MQLARQCHWISMPRQILDYRQPHPWRPRITRRRLFAVLLCSVVLVIGYWVFTPRLNWSGGAWAEVRVQVTDAATKKPISHATLQFLNSDGLPTAYSGTTDGAGIGTVMVMVGAGGTRSLVYETMGYGQDEDVILVRVPGYIDQTVSPGNGRTFRVFGLGPKPTLRVDVPLAPATTTTSTLPTR
jgi:hypothetical protein